jgi:hypothetical protein
MRRELLNIKEGRNMKENSLEVNDLDDEKQYQIIITCSDCNEVLNTSVVMTGKKIKEKWGILVMGSPINTGSCPNGCRATFSDCNLNTEMEIVEYKEEEKEKING